MTAEWHRINVISLMRNTWKNCNLENCVNLLSLLCHSAVCICQIMTHLELVDKLVSQLREMKHWNRPTLPKNCFNDLNTAVVGRTQRQNKLKKQAFVQQTWLCLVYQVWRGEVNYPYFYFKAIATNQDMSLIETCFYLRLYGVYF